MPVTVLVLVETINDYLPIIEGNGFHVILAPTPAERVPGDQELTAGKSRRC